MAGGFDSIADDDWGDTPHEFVIGWLVIVGTEEDEGRVILKTMSCDVKGKLRQKEQEISRDLRMPNFIRQTTWDNLQWVMAVLSVAQRGDPVLGVGQKIADDVYWIERSYEKIVNNG